MDLFDTQQIDRGGIEVRHKVAIADCVMAWAAFDCQLRALLTAIEGRSLDQGAAEYDKLWAKVAWTKLRQRMRDGGASEDVLGVIAEHKKAYGEHVEARNLIAHAGCVGVWTKDRDYLIFAPFEAHAPGQMVIVRQPLDTIARSTGWAKGFSEMAHRIMDSLGY